MLPVLEGYTAAVLEGVDASALPSTVAGLLALDAAADSNQELRGALTDTAVPGVVRAAVLRDVLGSKVPAPAVRLAAFAVARSDAQDVSVALHDVATVANARARDGQMPVEILSLAQSRQRVRGYADAQYEAASPADLERAEDELFQVARVIEGSDALRSTLVDREVPSAARVGAVRTLFEGKVSPLTLRIASYAVIGGRPRDIVGTLDDLVDHAAQSRRWRVARVWSARPMDDSERETIRRSLVPFAGEQVEVHVAVGGPGEDLLAGVIVDVGDVRLDATVRGRLQALRDAMVVAAGTSFTNTND
jgi:F-type H+-transporting ATPase subunit delta